MTGSAKGVTKHQLGSSKRTTVVIPNTHYRRTSLQGRDTVVVALMWNAMVRRPNENRHTPPPQHLEPRRTLSYFK